MSNVRVRFAPSPTGGLHIGGVRTALFNYLFAKSKGGQFLLRIEDTDQARFVPGAEDYIHESLQWLGITPDESPREGGPCAPYRQSERLDSYKKYAQALVTEGKAYYAFDTPDELESMRERLKAAGVTNLNYNSSSRMNMRNSLTLPPEKVQELLDSGEPHVIRIKVPAKEEIRFNDLIRGWVMVHAVNMDDKVLMKSDGFPTYHLANVVDDHEMKITHVIRGEEWLPSAPLHVLLYRYLGWESDMPAFAHLPLILKPDGNGKLSKRAADKAGFPIFPMTWVDPGSEEEAIGFREQGYMPEALVNFLALLGWNPGTEKELFSLDQLVSSFSLEKVGKAGTKFDIEKALWFNQQYIKEADTKGLAALLVANYAKENIAVDEAKAEAIIELLKPRTSYLHEFLTGSNVFFHEPTSFDEKVIRKKWNQEAEKGLTAFAEALRTAQSISTESAKELYSDTLNDLGLNPGSVMQILRLTLTGAPSGPDLMAIISIMGGMSASDRILSSMESLRQLASDIKQ